MKRNLWVVGTLAGAIYPPMPIEEWDTHTASRERDPRLSVPELESEEIARGARRPVQSEVTRHSYSNPRV